MPNIENLNKRLANHVTKSRLKILEELDKVENYKGKWALLVTTKCNYTTLGTRRFNSEEECNNKINEFKMKAKIKPLLLITEKQRIKYEDVKTIIPMPVREN